MDYESTRKVLEAIELEQVRYAVFGGVSLNLHGIARTTQDLDIFVEPTIDNLRRVKAALRRVFDDPEIDEIDEFELISDYPALRYIPPEGEFYIDLLTRLGEAFSYESVEVERLDFEGLEISVLTPRALYDMKKGTLRSRDRTDAARLAERFGFRD